MMSSLEGTRRREWVLTNSEEPILEVGAQKGDLFKGSDFEDVVMLDKDEYDTPYPFKQGNAYDLPFEDSSFQSVVLAEILEHLRNPIQALKEAKRVSSDRVVITVPDEQRWGELARPFQNPEHRRYYTGKMLGNQLSLVFDRYSIDHLDESPFAFWVSVCFS